MHRSQAISPAATSSLARHRSAFTLIEMIVVVVIMGVISAVAAPKFFGRADDAKLNSAKQSLNTVRGAIEQYRADNTGYPPSTDEATFKAALNDYIHVFPTCPVGTTDAAVKLTSSGTAITGDGTTGWAYDSDSGEFRINHVDYDEF